MVNGCPRSDRCPKLRPTHLGSIAQEHAHITRPCIPLNIYCFFFRIHKYYVFPVNTRRRTHTHTHTHIPQHIWKKIKTISSSRLGFEVSCDLGQVSFIVLIISFSIRKMGTIMPISQGQSEVMRIKCSVP
jgi:hypothetical protein